MVVSAATLADMLSKGNVWYIRHYETYFDQVYVVYVFGGPRGRITNARTEIVSLGKGTNVKLDLLLSPARLYEFAKKNRPARCLTADIVFSWWVFLFCRAFMRTKPYLMPVCIPEQIYSSTEKSLSGLPIWVERIFIRLSFAGACAILTARSFGNFPAWLSSNPLSRRKLIIVDTVVDAIASPGFFASLEKVARRKELARKRTGDFRLIYVGGLRREKNVDALVEMMHEIARTQSDRPISLDIIGDGPERQRLVEMSKEFGVDNKIRFHGSLPNEDLPRHLVTANAFISPLTGTSLREAGLCGLPIVAYDRDWIHGMLKHEVTALLVRPGDIIGLAQSVIRLADDEKLCEKLSQNISNLAWQLWSPEAVRKSLRQAFNQPARVNLSKESLN